MLFPRIIASTVQKTATQISGRSFSNTTAPGAKVAVLGAAGGIGQPLSMLCKLSDEVDELSCYDIVGTPGVAADLSHVSKYLFIFSSSFTVGISIGIVLVEKKDY